MKNLKVKMQLIGEDEKVLISATVNNDSIMTAKELHGVDMVNEIYYSLYDTIVKPTNL